MYGDGRNPRKSEHQPQGTVRCHICKKMIQVGDYIVHRETCREKEVAETVEEVRPLLPGVDVYEIDPSKRYIIQLPEKVDQATIDRLGSLLQQRGIHNALVIQTDKLKIFGFTRSE